MKLRFHNQLSKTIDDFKPITEGEVRLYTCGPTVYNYLTIGNWTAYIYWDILVRTLRAYDYNVTRVMNITDVGHLVSDADDGQDKLEKGAQREGKTAWDVAKMYTNDFINGLGQLNIIMPDHMPHATEYIPQQLDLVRQLKASGHTYQIDDGIYFDTSTFPTYADFAGLDLEALKAGARVEYNPQKRNPSDFALWKFTPTDQKRDMEWQTPADLTIDGSQPMGFPGWHIECSAMAMTLLGNTLDIHTGGIDHIPVHHTNEIAQSEAASGQRFSNYWLHNDHLKANGTKISKSLGNGYTLQDIKSRGYSPLDFRLFVLQSHYRTEGNFTFENLDAAKNRRLHWRNAGALRHQVHHATTDTASSAGYYATSSAVLEALGDDLNTPLAMSIIDELFNTLSSQSLNRIDYQNLVDFIQDIDNLLGLDILGTTPDISDDQKQLIIARTRAREQKDYEKSDQIRDELLAQNIILRDTPSGVIWEYSV